MGKTSGSVGKKKAPVLCDGCPVRATCPNAIPIEGKAKKGKEQEESAEEKAPTPRPSGVKKQQYLCTSPIPVVITSDPCDDCLEIDDRYAEYLEKNPGADYELKFVEEGDRIRIMGPAGLPFDLDAVSPITFTDKGPSDRGYRWVFTGASKKEPAKKEPVAEEREALKKKVTHHLEESRKALDRLREIGWN